MSADAIIKQQVEKALESNRMLDGAKIEVLIRDAEALLLGTAQKYYQKELARKTAKEVQGVRQVKEQIEIVIDPADQTTDKDIEQAIIEKFRKNFGNAQQDISVIVKQGQVWLDGTLKWKYQRELAQQCIMEINGITAIENHISTPDSAVPAIKEKDVFAAIYGDPSINTDIKIEIIGARVILKGKVEDVSQKNLVTRLVRNVDGVAEIENFLTVRPTT